MKSLKTFFDEALDNHNARAARSAIYSNNPEKLDGILARGISTAALHKAGVVFVAANPDDTACLQVLIKHKADLNPPSEYTPLSKLRGVHPTQSTADFMNLLLQGGANPNEKNENGNTILALRCKEELAFDPQAAACNTAMIKSLIRHGADVNLRNDDGSTPLMKAAAAGNTAACEMLLEAGAKADARCNKNYSALTWAGSPEIEQLLLKHGATPLPQGSTPWYVARQKQPAMGSDANAESAGCNFAATAMSMHNMGML